MPRFEIPQKWTTKTEGRECGSCYACCVWLGIEELEKFTGEPCQHLCHKQSTKRCTIYASRPIACSEYKCLWREGWGPEKMKPLKSGILITGYQSETDPGKATITVNVFDSAKAKPHVNKVIGELMVIPMIEEVRLIFIKEKRGILFKDGMIYRCKLLPPEGFESLIFAAEEESIGTYMVKETKRDQPYTANVPSSIFQGESGG